ncbi:hypothetical protein ABE237_22570 [Brevibacillus formosus]|uniref:hypothetical protein n=1 Tax=Brevibacillus formosus TaxID=54913 RepID=UPI0018CE3ADF|nr:hypothetical protein [Brevibacillus formosus]MBG9941766.1 hypothetical protein [Brevibacillus formosus]
MIRSNERPFTRQTVHALWQAVNSEHSERLMEITKEHTRLEYKTIDKNLSMSNQEKEHIRTRMDRLTEEKKIVIAQFEDHSPSRTDFSHTVITAMESLGISMKLLLTSTEYYLGHVEGLLTGNHCWSEKDIRNAMAILGIEIEAERSK